MGHVRPRADPCSIPPPPLLTVDTSYCNSPIQAYIYSFDMSYQLGSSRFETLFESALRDYEEQTGIPLAKHPLAEQFQNCQSVDSVTTLIQEQARAFSDFRGSNKVMSSLKGVVSALHRVSAIAALGQDIGMVCPSLFIGRSA